MSTRPERQIPEEDRSYVRFFAFWLANHTLIINEAPDDEDPEYEHLFTAPGPLLGDLFEHMLAEERRPELDASRWLYEVVTTGGDTPVVRLTDDDDPWRHAVARFARAFGERALATEPDIDLAEILVGWTGSPLEAVFATLTNVMALGPEGEVLNEAHAFSRAVDMIRLYYKRASFEELGFEGWEVELV